MIASNFPRPLRAQVSAQGAELLKNLKPEQAGQVPRQFHPNTDAYWRRVDNAIRGHQDMMRGSGTDANARLYSTQSLWDNSMGEACADALDKYPGHTVLHINGGFHSAYWDGTVHQLKIRKPDGQHPDGGGGADPESSGGTSAGGTGGGLHGVRGGPCHGPERRHVLGLRATADQVPAAHAAAGHAGSAGAAADLPDRRRLHRQRWARSVEGAAGQRGGHCGGGCSVPRDAGGLRHRRPLVLARLVRVRCGRVGSAQWSRSGPTWRGISLWIQRVSVWPAKAPAPRSPPVWRCWPTNGSEGGRGRSATVCQDEGFPAAAARAVRNRSAAAEVAAGDRDGGGCPVVE